MEKTKQFEIIDEQFIKENSVSALATKPNQTATYGTGNLTATELKAHFDSLVKKVIGLYNTLANALNGENAAEYITLKETEGGSLRGLLTKIIDKDGNLILEDRDKKTISEIITVIEDSIADMLDLTKEEAQTMKGPLETPRIKTNVIEGVVKFLNSIVVNELRSNNLSIKDEDGINTLLSVSKANAKGLLDVAALKTDAIAPSTNGGEVAIRGKSARVTGDLDVDGNSTLGRTAKVVNAGGTQTVTIDGEKGEVTAKRVITDYTSVDVASTDKLYAKQICSSGAGDRLIKIFHDLLGELPTKVDLYGSLVVSDNVDVGGNLNVKGKTINQIQESIIVSDNIIVTNSSGAGFSVSGIVMRTSLPDENAPNNPSEAYGILYSPRDEAVMIGKGTLTEIPNVSTGAVTYEFNFTPGEALPLAARDGFDELTDSNVPVWDKTKNAFLPSKIKFLTTDSGTTVLGGKVAIPSEEGGSVPVMDETIEYGVMFGENLKALHDSSVNPIKHVNLMGVGLKQTADDQIVRGKYNSPNTKLFYMLGNGQSSSKGSNAVSVTWEGTMYVANEVYVCGDKSRGEDGHGADPDGTGDYAPKRLATEAYVDEQLDGIADILDKINNGGSAE